MQVTERRQRLAVRCESNNAMNKKLAEVQEAAAAATTAAAAATLAANEKMQVVDAKDAQITELHQKKNEAQADASSAKAAKAAGEETIRSLGRELQKTKQNLSKVRGAARNGEVTPVLSHCLH